MDLDPGIRPPGEQAIIGIGPGIAGREANGACTGKDGIESRMFSGSKTPSEYFGGQALDGDGIEDSVAIAEQGHGIGRNHFPDRGHQPPIPIRGGEVGGQVEGDLEE
jgi:hypothetical protein